MRYRLAPVPTVTALLLTCLASLPSLAPAAHAADAFYNGLLRRGSLAYDSGDLVGAAKHLRLACFGLLDEPTALADCLVRLAATQGQLDRREAFNSTFSRLLEVEERFGGYSAAQPPAAFHQAFTEVVIRWVPRDTLQGLAAFAPIACELLETELLGLDTSGRRTALQQQIAIAADDPKWRRALAELELAAGNSSAALAAFDGLPPTADDATGRCLRGRALSILGRCGEALPELPSCGESSSDWRLAEHRLSCLLAVGEVSSAAQYYDRLPADVQRRKALRRLARTTRRQLAATANEGSDEEQPTSLEADPPTTATTAIAAPAASGADSPLPTAPPATTAITDRAASSIEFTIESSGESTAGGAAARVPPPSQSTPAQAPATPPASAADPRIEATLSELRQLLRQASSVSDPEQLSRLTDQALGLASRLPLNSEALRIAGELAYRDSRFTAAARYFDRAQPQQPALRFYFAVALYESGQAQRAASELRQILPQLQRSDYVNEIAARILGDTP